LFSRRWKRWTDWELFERKAVSFSRVMDYREIRDFDFTRKVLIDGTRYLVSELQVVLKSDTVSVANLKGYSCP